MPNFFRKTSVGMLLIFSPFIRDAAGVCIVKAQQQVDNGAFAASCSANNAQGFSFFQGKADVGKVVFHALIGKGDVLKLNMRICLNGVWSFYGHFVVGIYHLADSIGGSDALGIEHKNASDAQKAHSK